MHAKKQGMHLCNRWAYIWGFISGGIISEILFLLEDRWTFSGGGIYIRGFTVRFSEQCCNRRGKNRPPDLCKVQPSLPLQDWAHITRKKSSIVGYSRIVTDARLHHHHCNRVNTVFSGWGYLKLVTRTETLSPYPAISHALTMLYNCRFSQGFIFIF